MSDNWDFYYSKVDHKPAYIFFDIDISKEANLEHYSHIAYVRLYLASPNEEGLSTQEEYETLCNIEDSIESVLTSGDEAVYVGRNTSDGCRDFYFYTSRPESWDEKVKLALAEFPEYEFDSGERNDKDWSTYFEFIYPTSRNWETISSRKVCEQLEEKGDSLTQAREIDHWIYFKSEYDRKEFKIKVESMNYKVRNLIESEDSEESLGIQVYHIDIPSPYISLDLFDVANECLGDYSGWETQVV